MADLNVIKPQKVQRMINKFCCTIGMLPTSYKASLTYEEQILAIGHYLETVVYPAINQNAEALEELQGLFVALQDYVNNYFDNLDVQEEINNKLDEMAESGQLTEIIAELLELQGLLCYNTLADLKGADNLIDGSFTKTFGTSSTYDGKGYFYKIRTLINTDVIDEINLVALTNYPTLVAQRINPNSDLQCYNTLADLKGADNLIDGSFTKTFGTSSTYDGKGYFYKIRTKTNEDVIDDIIIIGLTNYPNLVGERISPTYKKKMIVIGDSYSASTQSGTPLWYKYIEKWDNLETYTTAGDGQGYSVGVNNFLAQLQNAKANVDLDDIDRIYVVGGLNDIGHSNLNDFKNSLITTFDYIKNNFPNIKVYIVGILPFQYYNWYTNFQTYNKADDFNSWLGYTTKDYDFIFISSRYFGLNIPGFYGEPNQQGQRHPSAEGEKFIANMIYNNNRIYSYGAGMSTPITSMPITVTNGNNQNVNTSIDRLDETGFNFKINNYDNTQSLSINSNPFPDFYYTPITDEKGNTNFLYNSNGTIKLPANTGLSNGTLYIHIPWDWYR